MLLCGNAFTFLLSMKHLGLSCLRQDPCSPGWPQIWYVVDGDDHDLLGLLCPALNIWNYRRRHLILVSLFSGSSSSLTCKGITLRLFHITRHLSVPTGKKNLQFLHYFLFLVAGDLLLYLDFKTCIITTHSICRKSEHACRPAFALTKAGNICFALNISIQILDTIPLPLLSILGILLQILLSLGLSCMIISRKMEMSPQSRTSQNVIPALWEPVRKAKSQLFPLRQPESDTPGMRSS